MSSRRGTDAFENRLIFHVSRFPGTRLFSRRRLKNIQSLRLTRSLHGLLHAEELKMGVKFTIVAALSQAVLIILFSVLVDYSNHALPPHVRKGGTGAAHDATETLSVNDVTVFYPSKPILDLYYCISVSEYRLHNLYSVYSRCYLVSQYECSY